MSKKLTRAQRLAKRKYKPSNKFIYWLYKVIMVNIVGKKYNMKFNVIDQVPSDGPCFVVFNHLSRIDHVYVMGATYPRVTTMIAANNEFYRSKFSLVFAPPIRHVMLWPAVCLLEPPRVVVDVPLSPPIRMSPLVCQ